MHITRERILLSVALAAIAGGLYVLLLVFAPLLPETPWLGTTEVEVTLASPPGGRGDRLYIPKINVDVPIGTGLTALNEGAWHRLPENGDPAKGGNFVLSAHRFVIGWTPGQTRNNSPFYHIDSLASGDMVYVDYKDKRYTYKVKRLYPVPKTATEIEGPSNEAKLTLYSCNLRGESAGRLVVEALPEE